MKVLCFGSMNLDHVYQMEHIVRPGETLSSGGYQVFPGGKGLNQTVALRRAGLDTWFAGRVGPEGGMLRTILEECGVHTEHLEAVSTPTGHAIIQVDKNGQNCILLYGGANQAMDEMQIRRVLDAFGPGDVLVCQNEINNMELLTRLACEKGMRLALNPSPINERMTEAIIARAAWLYVNEVEAAALSGVETTDPAVAAPALLRLNPRAEWIMTLGSEGACSITAEGILRQPCYRVRAVDTTAAGDTFTGYHLAAELSGASRQDALARAALAAGLAVSRPGASSSIPMAEEVDRLLNA